MVSSKLNTLLFFLLISRSWSNDVELSASRSTQMVEIWETHLKHEFVDAHKSTSLTMETMTDDKDAKPYVNHVPTLVGGEGKEMLTHFYENHFIHKNPAMVITSVSRTVGTSQIVDELIIELNHTSYIDWLVPGLSPTGKVIKFPLVVIVRFAENFEGKIKIQHEHIYWDQATVLKQLGALDMVSPSIDISGSEQAEKVLNQKLIPSNVFLTRTGRYSCSEKND